MTLPVVLRDEAQAEFDEAFDFYEQRRAGLGVAFVTKVQEVFDRIAANPRMHAVVFADIRKAVVAKFPYCVYYRAEQARV
jgi:plasmid stabilization system protein ParE